MSPLKRKIINLSRKKKITDTKFPDVGKTVEESLMRGWPIQAFPAKSRYQTVVPRDPELKSKLGVKQGEKILVFAGCFGDWSKALSRFSAVHYTDVSKEMRQFAEKQKKGGIKTFRARPAELMPQTPNNYHWSFSFEPIPLVKNLTPFKLALLRSLLNIKGAKMVYRGAYIDAGDYGMEARIIKAVAENYGAEHKMREISIGTKTGAAEKHYIMDLLTNEEAKQKAILDLKVLRLLRKNSQASDREIARVLKVQKEEIKNSRQRLDALERIER